jgi:hypothetical protein
MSQENHSMGHAQCLLSFSAILLTFVGLMACSSPAARQVTPAPAASSAPGPGQQGTFTDPFTYCAALGTVDAPDSRYTGPKVPEAVARGLKKAFGAPADAPLEPFLNSTVWRCMDGTVYACMVGANLPCQEHADTSSRPTQGMTDFCKNNPRAEVIPAFATGRATVYEWKCTGGAPEIVRQFAQPDVRGFLSHIWYAISPAP